MNHFAAPVIMAIKPRFAELIYEGRKVWEFRKAPPPLQRSGSVPLRGWTSL